MPQWQNPRFFNLLSPVIWSSNYEEINIILGLPEWEEPKFQKLLTPSIWKSNPHDIKTILSMEEWQDPKYEHLLGPGIFSTNPKNIIPVIKLFEEYGISCVINNRCLRRNVVLQRQLIEYLRSKNISLIYERLDGTPTINPMLSASNTELKEKYGLDIKNLPNAPKKRVKK